MGERGDPGPGGPADRRFDLGRDLICIADVSGRLTSLNAAWEQVLGWSREELMARPLIEFVHPEDVEHTARLEGRVAQADVDLAPFENRYRTKDGGYRWLRWNARTDGETWFRIAFDITERKLAEERLRDAIAEQRLLAYSQPIVDQRTAKVVQEELLVRMRVNGNGHVLLPHEFLPEAERSGAIGAIDRWMAMRGIELAGQGRNVEINLSPRSIADEALVSELAAKLREAGGSARRIVFEITETAALDNLEAMHDLADRLGRLGCLIALDDFGTGYASLTHLRTLPVHMLKIDASFVGGIRERPADRALVRGIAAIARELDLWTVAEGVEDAITYRLLRHYGIDRAQGYLIGRPAPV